MKYCSFNVGIVKFSLIYTLGYFYYTRRLGKICGCITCKKTVIIDFSIDPASSYKFSPAYTMRSTVLVVTQKSDTRKDKCGAALGIIGDNSLDNHKTIKAPSMEAASSKEDILQ